MNKDHRLKEKFIILCLALLFLGSILSIKAQDKKVQDKKDFPFPFTQYKLENGLQVILSEDQSLPVVSVVVAYDVGSINEPPGKTGLAYLMENLMFQGSENVNRMQHISLINKVGGELSATTTEDKTIFFQRVPSNQLTQVLWLESDRMKSLQINASNVEQAKQALIGGIKSMKESEPYLRSFWRFDQLLYSNFAYSHPVIGDEEDVKNLTVQDVNNFYRTYYVPNNAVLTIVGKIDREKTLEDVRKYFETIPEGREIPNLPLPSSPVKETIVESIEAPFAPSPGFLFGYRLPYASSDEFYTLSIIEYILLKGTTSRIQKKLLKRERTALYLNGGIEVRKELAGLKIFVVNNNPLMVQRSKRAIFSELHKLKKSYVSDEELKKSKNMFKMDYISQYTSSLDRALFLAETFIKRKILLNPSEELEKYLAVTPIDIARVSNKYFGAASIILDIKTK
jgi:predicted Zn-dependent peptidase